MATIPLRDTNRYVLFLENPTRMYRDEMEGHLQSRVDTQVRQFLTNSSPASALENESKFPPPLCQLKDRGAGIRGLGTWCSGSEYDLFIIQALFDKADEDWIYSRIGGFQSRGEDLRDRFDDMSFDEIEAKADEWRQHDELRLVTP